MSDADERRSGAGCRSGRRWVERIDPGLRQADRDPAGVTAHRRDEVLPGGRRAPLGIPGVHDMGENRDQEASHQVAEVREDTPGCGCTSSVSCSPTRPPVAATPMSCTPSTALKLVEAWSGRPGRSPVGDCLVLVDLDR
jgi:hypothetical protein